jgi:hypothetical protein
MNVETKILETIFCWESKLEFLSYSASTKTMKLCTKHNCLQLQTIPFHVYEYIYISILLIAIYRRHFITKITSRFLQYKISNCNSAFSVQAEELLWSLICFSDIKSEPHFLQQRMQCKAFFKSLHYHNYCSQNLTSGMLQGAFLSALSQRCTLHTL